MDSKPKRPIRVLIAKTRLDGHDRGLYSSWCDVRSGYRGNMKFFEFEAKNILRKYGISIPIGKEVNNSNDAAAIAREIGKAVFVKAQILVAGRGRAGGTILAASRTGSL